MEVIASEAAQMHKCLQTPGRLMASLKHATLMISELREELPPRQYYERFSACFDALSQLSASLQTVHQSHHLSDIYEHVQYASFAVPRLYLMVTVGAAFMSIEDAPRQDILDDMLEMARGVQNPTRGLFLRYYLAQRVREYLPDIETDHAVQFVLRNFVEMNKLWVRMQHSGPSTERQKRAAERRELQTIVGFNLERLAYLNLDLEYFRDKIFPPLLQQIIHCRDPLAQEYLLDVICSAFPAEFHLGTLDVYLDACAQLSPATSLPGVLLQSIDRLTQWLRDEWLPEHKRIEAAKKAKAEAEAEAHKAKDKSKDTEKSKESKESKDSKEPESKEPKKKDEKDEPQAEVKEHLETKEEAKEESSLPDVALLSIGPSPLAIFDTYRSHFDSLKDRLNHGQRAQIARGLARLAFLLDNSDIERIHELLMFVEGESGVPNSAIVDLLLDLLEYIPLLELISFGTFKRLLSSQDKAGQQAVAGAVLKVLLANETSITSLNVAKQIFELFGLITKSGNMETLQLSRLVYLLKDDVELLKLAHTSLRQGGVQVVQQTYGALVTAAIRALRASEEAQHSEILKFIGRVINDLATIGSQPEAAFRLYTLSALVADQVPQPEVCYEFYVQAFTLYEEHISDSKAQYQAICILTGSLQKCRQLGEDNYTTLAQRCAQYGQKLLKKADQCRAIYMAAHLWYVEDGDTVHFSDNARVLDTLQRALRVADACMDAAVSLELFVEVLNRFLYFLERDAGDVTPKHVNGLIELVRNNLKQSEEMSESPRKYFERTLAFIESDDGPLAELIV